MAFKIILLVAVLCAMQVVHAASVQKRNILLNAINETISQIQQNVQAGISEAQRIIQRVGNQTASVIANVTAGLQTTATTIITQATRYPTCATAQNASVANIVSQAGTNIQKCATSAIGNLSNAYSDLLNVSRQAAQIVQEAAAQNIFNLFTVITSRGLQLASSVIPILTELTRAFPTATAQIPICGAIVAGSAGQQLNDILAKVQSCVQSG